MSAIDQARRLVQTHSNIVVLTGAGMSAESGIPTFRFRQAPRGLWAEYSPERLATPEAWRADPALVWGITRSRGLHQDREHALRRQSGFPPGYRDSCAGCGSFPA